MKCCATLLAAVLLCALPANAAVEPGHTIGAIDFFGYEGLDVGRTRAALPMHAGDSLTDHTEKSIEAAVVGAIGVKPTDIAVVCCDAAGRQLIYIGLPGKTYRLSAFNQPPTASEHLPEKVADLYDRADEAWIAAVKKGGGAADENDSMGFALAKDPATRRLQLQKHAWAVAHEAELIRVLRGSSDKDERQIASDLLGYSRQSPAQINTLVQAASDPDSGVRNNATRALGVLVTAKPALARTIPPEKFIAMLYSGTWFDRNKAVGLLVAMTARRDQALLAKIKAQGLDPLVEIAEWSEAGHAGLARIVLGRIGGIPEQKLGVLVLNGPVEEIVNAALKR